MKKKLDIIYVDECANTITAATESYDGDLLKTVYSPL